LSDKLIELENQRERQEALEHRDVLLAIGVLLKQQEGVQLFEYLFKTLDVTQLPESDMEDKILHEYLGFLRAGNAIYKLVCEADHVEAASILSKLERKRYEQIHEQHRVEHDYATGKSNY